jgi:PEGA domain
MRVRARSCVRLVAGVLALATAASCVPPGNGGGPAPENGPPTREGTRASVDAARELDQQGIRSYRSGRYVDAIAYFRAAFRLGGPSSELWNIVRCREGMGDAEGAASAIDDYLAQTDVAVQDRADAEREAQALKTRPSVLTVTTNPSGASLTIDGKPAPGATPLSVELRSGSHSVTVRSSGYLPVTESVDARFGRAVIVTLDLERTAK